MSELVPIPEEPEIVPGRPIAMILVATVLAISVCVVVVWTLDAFHLAGGGRSALQSIESIPPAEPFSSLTTPEQSQLDRHSSLDRWSWIDRAHGTVSLPVGIAIERYVGDKR